METSGQPQVIENTPPADALNTDCTNMSNSADVAVERETLRETDSKESKRGGKRPGAGRKPNLAKRLLKGFTRDTIAQAAADIDVREVIVGLLKAKSERTRLETLAFLRDTLYGRPAQSVSLSGALVHAHGAWRPLENLSDEEMLLLDSITKKINGSSQDGSQNQIESKPDIEAEVVEDRAHSSL